MTTLDMKRVGPNDSRTDFKIIPTDIESVNDNADGTCTLYTDGGHSHVVVGNYADITAQVWPD